MKSNLLTECHTNAPEFVSVDISDDHLIIKFSLCGNGLFSFSINVFVFNLHSKKITNRNGRENKEFDPITKFIMIF